MYPCVVKAFCSAALVVARTHAETPKPNPDRNPNPNPNPNLNAQVFEETGLDIGGRFDERDCVEIWVKHGVSQKRTKLFFVPGIDTATEFAPQARKVGGPEP